MNKWSPDELAEHWMVNSAHEDYVDGEDRSSIIVKLISDAWPDRLISILEPGCNIGRNLHFLVKSGYLDLSGIDMSPRALPFMNETFPDVAKNLTFYEGSIEHWIVQFRDDHFDVVFTMAVLEHIHPSSEWIFGHLARIARLGIVLVEDEASHSVRMWPRKYKEIFEGFGLVEDFARDCAGFPGLNKAYWARRFLKETVADNGNG